jgi:hypothetical protein
VERGDVREPQERLGVGGDDVKVEVRVRPLVASPWTPLRENDDHHGMSLKGPSNQSIHRLSPDG